MPADEGEMIGAKDLTFGYLPQDGLFCAGAPCWRKRYRSSNL